MSLQEKITAKREELHELRQLKKFTGLLAVQLEQIEAKLDTMADGAESVALILSNWQNVMNSVSLASLGLLKHANKDYDETPPLPECLVRISLDKDKEEDN
ncbi:CIC11C00000002320 [Sungouiella intermedia]|uniref:DASH complex subunit DAD2 n=1 Tax=Sungouiella intermedia TaxID=45354 RepID=A0A1L0C5Q2_9ASCO|nr:CIC11C00000002320 [[Candida] intermedia]